MIKYLRKINVTLIEQLVWDTVKTIDYDSSNDQSDQEDYIQRKFGVINQTLYEISVRQLSNRNYPKIVYSNYRKLFNKTLIKVYREQVKMINFLVN